MLLRPPNFLTVPGDLFAGFFLAAGSVSILPLELLWVLLAGIFFYAAGLLLNDWADAAVDRIERPERPEIGRASGRDREGGGGQAGGVGGERGGGVDGGRQRSGQQERTRAGGR